jgi:hypothetical protein
MKIKNEAQFNVLFLRTFNVILRLVHFRWSEFLLFAETL